MILVAVGLATAAAVLVGPALVGSGGAPTLHWRQDDELVVQPLPEDPSSIAAVLGQAVREALPEIDPGVDRMEIVLRGRVVDSFRSPVRQARVWLDIGRGGRGDPDARRRLPEPVVTGKDGRFAFQGQAFRNLRVSFLVAHPEHAPTNFERDLGASRAEMDVGELVVTTGGSLFGRVTDLEGFAVPDAELRLQPENDNRRRFERDLAQVFAAQRSDRNGYYRFDHVPPGDWHVEATAPRHEEGRSSLVTAEDALRVELDDIRLGPGYELAGLVSDVASRPVAEAVVLVRARRAGRESRPPRGGPGGFGLGPEYRTSTDAQGRFHLDHLPGLPVDLTIEKTGYLRHEQREIDVTLRPPLFVTLLDGLQVHGRVLDGVTAAPVEMFAVRAQRLRALPRVGEPDSPPGNEVQVRMGRMGGAGGSPRVPVDPGPPEHHAGGEFAATGLQEGVYTLVVRSPAHARHRSPEFELRAGVPSATIEVRLDRGIEVRGLVRDHGGEAIAGARVELRPAAPDNAGGPGMRLLDTQTVPLEASTDAEGRFTIAHAVAGRYRVVASAAGHDEAQTEPFELRTDVGGVELQLGQLGALAGRVLGATPDQLAETRVIALPLDEHGNPVMRARIGNPFVQVAADGRYRFDNLSPSGYVVRAFTGDGMRGLFAQFFGAALTPDVFVQAGLTATFDATLVQPETGAVRGSVLHNGQPATGFQITLHQQEDAASQPGAGRVSRRGFAPFGRAFNAVVGATGHFEIDNVPTGSYRLTVRSARRGGVLHSEAVVVQTRITAEVTVSLLTAVLRGQVTVEDGTPAADLDGNLLLLPGLTEPPQDLRTWTRDNPSFNARVENGRFQAEILPSGSYLALLTIRGRAPATAQVFASPGQATSVSIAAGARSASEAQPTPRPRGERRGTGEPPGPGGQGRRIR